MIVSIILPVYNAEPFLERCITSIYINAPSAEFFEVIAINDGSTDRTIEILNMYSQKHSNISLINKKNEGVSVARNIGVKVAKGEYVLFLDADDELIDGGLAKVCSYLNEHTPIDMLVTRQLRNEGKTEWLVAEPKLEEHKRYNGVEAFKNQFVRTNAGGGICRRVFLLENNLFFPEGIRNAEDTEFFGHLQVYAQSIVFYNLPLYRIHVLVGTASRNTDHTKLGKSHVLTMRSVVEIKKSLKARREQKAIFDFVVYQLLSNTIAYFVSSKNLTYCQFRNEVNTHQLLPLDTRNMYIMRNKAKIMNISCTLFYFLSWLKYRFGHSIKYIPWK